MKKILIAEDDPMLSEIYQKKLSQEFEVITAVTGMEAVSKAGKEAPDLMLLDLVLPELDGFEVLKKVKENPDSKNVKVLVFSNLSQQEDKEKATALGADGFIAKSDFTPQQIVDEIKKTLSLEGEEKKGGSEEQLEQVEPVEEVTPAMKEKNGDKNVLLVEDEEVFLDVFGKKLKDAGFNLVEAKNGAWALQKMGEEKYDLIIMDILMPELSGIEVLDKIHEGKNKETPVLVISNSIEEHQVKEIIEKGAMEVIIKTHITPSELLDKVEEIL